MVRQVREAMPVGTFGGPAAEGSSLEGHLRRLLAEASGLDRHSFLSVADDIAANTAGREHTDATDLLRADRDRDRR